MQKKKNINFISNMSLHFIDVLSTTRPTSFTQIKFKQVQQHIPSGDHSLTSNFIYADLLLKCNANHPRNLIDLNHLVTQPSSKSTVYTFP